MFLKWAKCKVWRRTNLKKAVMQKYCHQSKTIWSPKNNEKKLLECKSINWTLILGSFWFPCFVSFKNRACYRKCDQDDPHLCRQRMSRACWRGNRGCWRRPWLERTWRRILHFRYWKRFPRRPPGASLWFLVLRTVLLAPGPPACHLRALDTWGKKLKTRSGKTVACGFLPGWSLEPRSPVRAGGWLGLEAAPPPPSRPRRASVRHDAQDRAAPPHWPAGVRHTSPPSHNNPLVRRLYDNVQFIKGQRFPDTFGRNPARPLSPEWETGFNSWDEEELTILALNPHLFPLKLDIFHQPVTEYPDWNH